MTVVTGGLRAAMMGHRVGGGSRSDEAGIGVPFKLALLPDHT